MRTLKGVAAATLQALFLMAVIAAFGVPPVQAAESGVTVTLPAAGSVEVPVEGFCMNYGKPFPS
ncbi:hypothetical protein, partial [Oceanithermus sp.]|uniref:hypothetical protein n=1 Tax=Oceanithermus sp. TaxID=2268145 RepID=UPI002600E4C4